MTATPQTPESMRRLDTPAALALADLAAMLDDLQTVLGCCERLIAELGSAEPDDVLVEGLWTTALVSYCRCFTGNDRGVALTEDDLAGTSLRGEVSEWHAVLRDLRAHYTDPDANPRGRFSVGAVLDDDGGAGGIAITSTQQPRLDAVTVRQTGALAYQLAQRVERRITEHQERVREAAGALSAADLDRLPRVDVAAPETADPGAADT